MEKKKTKFVVILLIVVAAVIIAAYFGITSYLSSRSVELTMDDVISTVTALKNYLIVIGVVIALSVVACIVTIKKEKHVRFMVHGQALVASLLAVVIGVNVICMGPQYVLMNNMFGDQYYLTDETAAEAEDLVREIASEGMVLLKNEDDALPLDGSQKLNVFGWSSTNPVYGGTGSGSVNTETCVTLLQGLENAGFEINSELVDFYTDYCSERPELGMFAQDWTIPEPTIEEYEDAGIFENAKEFSDVALIVVSRSGGEDFDLPTSIKDEDTLDGGTGVRYSSNADDIDPSKSYLELSNREAAMVERVAEEFSTVIVIVNSANAMELGWLDEYDSIKAAIWAPGPGETGFDALGLILNGSVNPSGKLVDTFVYDLLSIPSINYYDDLRYDNMDEIVATDTADDLYVTFNNYVEGIYVGYKFYETAAVEGLIDYDTTVQYPFGYGLSYTQFEQEIVDFTNDGTTITLDVAVTNIGDTAGKDVVQVYYTPPYTNGGIEKSEVNLVQFAKTDELAPGETETVTISFALEDMASYDSSEIIADGGAYVLEEGTYTISIRSDSHTVLDSEDIELDRDYIYNDENDGARDSDGIAAVNQFDFAEGSVTYLSRADGFANYEEAVAAPTNFSMSEEEIATFFSQNTYDASLYDDPDAEMPTTEADNGLTIRDMVGLDYDDEQWDLLLDQLSVSEMNSLIALGGYGISKIDSIDLPALIECDGPAAINNNYTGQSGTAFCCATMIAATWNTELATRRGEMMGLQCYEMNVVGWYGPAMNIHRSAFSGRNFEYYSEDGVLSGYMGASEISGAREYGLLTYMKHFALNDSETNRGKMLCTWTTEQALREIYLKPFEISVKEGGTMAAMTAFNYVGNVWTGACYELLQTVLRDEWGFQGATVSDYFHGLTGGYMLADAAVRAGGDRMLTTSDPLAYVSDTDNPASVVAMRQAVHNILYTVANSNAMDDRNFSTPGWVKVFIGADVAAGVVLLLIEGYVFYRFKKLRSNKS